MAQVKPRNTIATEIWILILAHLLVFLIPALLILFIPIFLYRFLVYMSSGFLGPDLGQMLSSISALLATDDMYNKPKSNCLSLMVTEGELGVERVRKQFYENAVRCKTADDELKNPELQQYITTWMGFHFWKWDRTFNIKNHIREYDGQIKYEYLDEKTLYEINNELISKPWAKCQSPWELLLFPNYRPKNDETPGVTKTVCIMRFHHALGDGISISKLIATDACGFKLDMLETNNTQQGVRLWRKVLDCLSFILRLPYDVSSTMVKSNDPISQFHLREDQLSGRNNLVTSSSIPLSNFKEIRERTKASLPVIIMAAFTGALRALMLEHWGEVPEYVSTINPLPFPGHPNKLSNHLTIGIVSLPVGLSDPGTRLRAIEANLKAMKNSTFPTFAYWNGRAVGSLLPFMTSFLSKQRGPAADISNLPTSTKQIMLFGRPMIDWSCNTGNMPGSIGIALTSLTCNGKIKFTVGIDESILARSKGNMDVFMDYMLQELEVLKQMKIM